MILARLAVISLIILNTVIDGNEISGTFQVCNLQCSNEGETSPPVSDNILRASTLLRGKSGPRGDKGKVGHKGAKGAHGEKGEDGRQGVKGSHGAKGQVGRQGLKGEDGTSSNETLIEQLNNRITELESDATIIQQLQNITTKLESDATMIQQLQNRITELESDATMIQQLQNRITQLEGESDVMKNLRPQNCSQIKEHNPEATTGEYTIYDHLFSNGRQMICDMTSEGECANYSFTVTSKLSFHGARAQCLELGGDLLQNKFGPEGALYHDDIRQFAMDNAQDYISKSVYIWGDIPISGIESGMWIGFTDIEEEGIWRYLNGDLYDGHDRGQSAVAYWKNYEPNNANGGQHCAVMRKNNGALVLADDTCSKTFFRGLCAVKSC